MYQVSSTQRKRFARTFCASLFTVLFTGCVSTNPVMGGSSGNTVTGGAGGGNAEGSNAALESCDATLGTLSVFEDTSLAWWHDYRSRYPKLGSTLPVIRLMIQQSNCFVVVERGASMAAMNRERELMQSGQLRAGSNIGGGQMVAADYTLSPSIQFSQAGTSGFKAIGGALLGSIGSVLGGGMSKNEASTTLLLIENRSGVQVSAAVGNAGNYDFDVFGGMFAGFAGGGAKAYSNTPQGKIITAAFADSFNQMVKALRNYKAQEVKGGLGKGGTLTIGGADDKMPEANTSASIPSAPAPKPVYVAPARATHTIKKRKSYEFDVEEYDESALRDYYNSLKSASTMISGLASFTSDSVIDERTKSTLKTAMNMFSSQLESHRIELQSWPMEAKREAWRVMGKRIEQHTASFEKYRTIALDNKSLEPSVRNMLNNLQLITKESLLGV